MPNAHIVQAGIALGRLDTTLGDTVVSCGVAGGLRPDLPTGTLLIPREVRRPAGGVLHCDAELVDVFARSARSLGIEPVFDPLLTARPHRPRRGTRAMGRAEVSPALIWRRV